MIYDSDSLSGPWTFRGAAIPDGSSINLPGKDDLWVRLPSQKYPFDMQIYGIANRLSKRSRHIED